MSFITIYCQNHVCLFKDRIAPLPHKSNPEFPGLAMRHKAICQKHNRSTKPPDNLFSCVLFHSVLAENDICWKLPSKHLKYLNYWLRLRNQYGLHCCSFFPTQVRWWHQIHATMGPNFFYESLIDTAKLFCTANLA